MTRLSRTPFTVHEIGKAVAAARLTLDLAVLAIRKDAEPYLPHGAYWQNATYDTEDGCFKLSYRWAHMTHMLLMIDSDGVAGLLLMERREIPHWRQGEVMTFP